MERAHKYLNQAYKMDRQIRIILRKVEKLRASLEYRSPSLDSSSGGASSDRMPDTLSKIMVYEKDAKELQAELIDKYIEIDNVIQGVRDTKLREVLERRYLLYQKWNQIALEMNYSIRRITQLHTEALENISLNFPIDVCYN